MALDLSKFAGTLPYDSQLYGIYQPLLGWKSGLQSRRLGSGLAWTRRSYLWTLAQRYQPKFSIQSSVADAARFEIEVAQARSSLQQASVDGIDGLLTQHIAAAVHAVPPGERADAWAKYTSPAGIAEALRKIQDPLRQAYESELRDLLQNRGAVADGGAQVLGALLARESIAAGVFSELHQRLTPVQLENVLMQPVWPAFDISALLHLLDPAESDMAAATLSPIGVVHLFRQYFFEFATFLGPAVQHVWLSPGGTVELIEVSTRRQLIERSIEQSFESIQKSEKDTTTQDELSDAVKQENASDTKLGVSATSNTNYNSGFVNGSVTVNGSFNLDQQQKLAREQTHKSTRQQSQKLSSEIRQSYKSTLKTVTETTDTSSKRYVLQNTTDKLVNYELRRKMRQVGVQLQDYGTRLCWQAYVDNPGDALGVPIFVHAAPPPDLQSIKAPEAPPDLALFLRGDAIVIRGGWDHGDQRQWNFVPVGTPASIVPPAGYVYDHAELTVQQGPPWYYRVWPANASDTQLQVQKDPPLTAGPDIIAQIGNVADGTNESSVVQIRVGVVTAPGGLRDSSTYDIALQVTPIYRPSLAARKATTDNYNAALAKLTEQTKQAYQQSLFQSVRERVKLASNIRPRDFGELREEERIVVYRRLVDQLLKVAGVTTPDPHVRHVFSEIVQSMFDMDSMLYFVAPDWWMPRQAVTAGDALAGLGITTPEDQAAYMPGSSASTSGPNVVGWGGARGVRSDNYYITEDSTPAKLGSSLGWLLQLDGDNFRNAFLNAPWVKAVIPIQEGHEWKALDWLSSSTVEGAVGLDALYQETVAGEKAAMLDVLKAYKAWPDASLAPRYAGLQPEDLTILDAVRYLIVVIQAKQAVALKKVADPADPTLSYLPTDKVYEHGFDPLAGGFVAQATTPFEVFDQWIEVLPTDQIVPVEVAYNPKTGQQL